MKLPLLSTKADIQYWGKLDSWSLKDAITLTFGFDPRRYRLHEEGTKVDSIQKVCQKVMRSRQAGERAEQRGHNAESYGQLYDPVDPMYYIDWARKHDIHFCPELEEVVLEYNNSSIKTSLESNNYKDLYEEMTAKYDVLLRNKEINFLTPNARDKMLLIIIGLVKDKYKSYPAPEGMRSDQTKIILSNLRLQGVKVDDATFLKYVRQGNVLLERLNKEI